MNTSTHQGNQSHIAPHIIFEYFWGRENVGVSGTSESSHLTTVLFWGKLVQLELPPRTSVLVSVLVLYINRELI